MTETPPPEKPPPASPAQPEMTSLDARILRARQVVAEKLRSWLASVAHITSNVIGSGRSVILAVAVILIIAGFYPVAFRFDLTAETRVVDLELPAQAARPIIVKLPIGHGLATGFSNAEPQDEAATLRLDPGGTLSLASSGTRLTIAARCPDGASCIVYTSEAGGIERHDVLIAVMDLTNGDRDPASVVTLPPNATYFVGGDNCALPDAEVPGGVQSGQLRTEAEAWLLGGAYQFREQPILLGDHVRFDDTTERGGTGAAAGSVYIAKTGMMSVRIRGRATELELCRLGGQERAQITQDMFTLLVNSRIVQMLIAALAVGLMLIRLSKPNPEP